MKTRCPHCQKIMEASADTNGLEMKCPACQKKFTVEPTAIIIRKNSAKRFFIWILILVAILVIAGGAAYCFVKKNPVETQKKKVPPKHEFSYASEEVFNLPGGVKLEMVKTPRGDYLGKYEVTQGQWKSLMGTDVYQQKAKGFADGEVTGVGDRHPMYFVTQEEASQFCRELNYRGYAPAGWKFCLPHSHWYVRYGIRLDEKPNLEKVNYKGSGTVEVGLGFKNKLGVYDVYGNVVEWLDDSNIIKESVSEERVINKKMTSMIFSSEYSCWREDISRKSNTREYPERRSSYIGFRLVLVPAK